MRKLKLLLVAAVAAVPFAPVAAQASHPDCQEETCPPADHGCTFLFHSCFGACPVDPPVTIGDDVIFFNEDPLAWLMNCTA